MDKQKLKLSPGLVTQLLVFIVLVPFLPLLISTRWDWWQAWVYGLVGVFGFVISRVLVNKRHPGYAGALLTYFATPLLLDSPWTFLPVFLMTVVLVIRTVLEDRTLREELPGYKEFTGQTRYRLIPGVW